MRRLNVAAVGLYRFLFSLLISISLCIVSSTLIAAAKGNVLPDSVVEMLGGGRRRHKLAVKLGQR